MERTAKIIIIMLAFAILTMLCGAPYRTGPSIPYQGSISDFAPYNQYLFVDITGFADDAYNDKDYITAESLYQKAYQLAFRKNNYKLIGIALLGLGTTLGAQAEYSVSITKLNNCLHYKDNIENLNAVSQIYYNLAISYHYLNKLDTAIQNYTFAINLNLNAYWAYANRADAYREKQSNDSAISDYNRAVKLDSTNAIIYCNRGLAYLGNSEYGSAIPDYHKAIELKPNYADAMVYLADAYLIKNDKISAQHWYEQALQYKEHLKVWIETEIQKKYKTLFK